MFLKETTEATVQVALGILRSEAGQQWLCRVPRSHCCPSNQPYLCLHSKTFLSSGVPHRNENTVLTFFFVLKQGLITQAVLELAVYLMRASKSWCSGLRIPCVVVTSVCQHTQQEHSCLFQMLISDHRGLPVCLIPYKMERLLTEATFHYKAAKTALCSEWLRAVREKVHLSSSFLFCFSIVFLLPDFIGSTFSLAHNE